MKQKRYARGKARSTRSIITMPFRMPSTTTARDPRRRKALQDSLRQLELQCKERVDLLETLKKSREDATKESSPWTPSTADAKPPPPPAHGVPTTTVTAAGDPSASSWLGRGTIPPVDYSDIYRPPLPLRPSLQPRRSSGPEATRVPQCSAAFRQTVFVTGASKPEERFQDAVSRKEGSHAKDS